MAKERVQGIKIRRYIIDRVENNPTKIVELTAKRFGISRQAVHKHLQKLILEKKLLKRGETRRASYRLAPLLKKVWSFKISKDLKEDVVWSKEIAPAFSDVPENVRHIWFYGFTEMLNNVVDHSEGKEVVIELRRNAKIDCISIIDDGVGIFKKIQNAMRLDDERHAVLELAKGKFTTDPANHSGEGIFFTSRMFDRFQILSGSVYFSHQDGDAEDWILQTERREGTCVVMELSNNSKRTTKSVFDQFSTGDDYGFTKTIVPVSLAQYGDDQLVSRSQAKRLLTRFERFKKVVLDFKGVSAIGQAFADEVFRVFQNEHPDVELLPVNTEADVQKMISRVRSHR